MGGHGVVRPREAHLQGTVGGCETIEARPEFDRGGEEFLEGGEFWRSRELEVHGLGRPVPPRRTSCKTTKATSDRKRARLKRGKPRQELYLEYACPFRLLGPENQDVIQMPAIPLNASMTSRIVARCSINRATGPKLIGSALGHQQAETDRLACIADLSSKSTTLLAAIGVPGPIARRVKSGWREASRKVEFKILRHLPVACGSYGANQGVIAAPGRSLAETSPPANRHRY